jgi:hypothetical protein
MNLSKRRSERCPESPWTTRACDSRAHGCTQIQMFALSGGAPTARLSMCEGKAQCCTYGISRTLYDSIRCLKSPASSASRAGLAARSGHGARRRRACTSGRQTGIYASDPGPLAERPCYRLVCRSRSVSAINIAVVKRGYPRCNWTVRAHTQCVNQHKVGAIVSLKELQMCQTLPRGVVGQ